MANLFRLIVLLVCSLCFGMVQAQEGESPRIESCSHYSWKPTCSAPPAAFGWYLAKTEESKPQPDIVFSYVYCRVTTGLVQYPNGVLKCVPQQCEANAESVNGQCQCKEGFEKDQTGACVKKPDDKCPDGQIKDASGACVPDPKNKTDDQRCADAAVMHNTVGVDRVGRIGGKQPLGEEMGVCRNSGVTGGSGQPLGCMHRFTGEVAFQTPNGWITEGESWANNTNASGTTAGLACALGLEKDPNNPADADKAPEANKPPKDCRGGFTGSVNGVNVCVDRASTNTNGVDWTRITDGDGKQVDIRTDVNCTGDRCLISQSKKPVDGGATVTTQTSVDRTQFCRQNPKNPVCGTATGASTNNGNGTTGGNTGGNGNGDGDKEPSSFGGSCGAFSCEGDAIQCAIAKEQHKRACEMFDAKDTPEMKLVDAARALDGKGKVTGSLEGNREVDLSTVISTRDQFLGGGGSCPADTTINLPGAGSFVISWTLVCPTLVLMGHVLVILSSISAAFIVLKRD
ncbi:virulence factor TspB C-terminal domain-related protein [Acidovorax sp. SUPP2539]|uniref:virulence factor TspB C-terminal domain-related protein n=1 Tax=Acidovorax sp. SUPP2539 TaxID=2920878 RepID=UPI0023DE4758|nr:virulence factor TspB C-terminal domain-related protein [Acidovorax sp. SUPP2539]GKS88230.1 hypothetical protein AVTE2539_02715 [Acidovorax sp. SUPP2539]